VKENKRIIVMISIIVIFILALIGISYAAFTYVGKGDVINQITTAEISMDYKESDNVISLNKALPTTDETGKVRLKEGEYFDFSVSTRIAGNTIINWEIAAEDFEDNTFDGKNVKFYLTKLVDGKEVPVSEDLPKVYKEDTGINKHTGRPANMMSLLVGSSNTIGKETTNYRLRLYVDEAYNPQGDGGGLIFKTRINVYSQNNLWYGITSDDGVIIDRDATVGDIVHFEVEERQGYIYDGAEVLNKEGNVIETIPNDKKEFVMPEEEISIKVIWKAIEYNISKVSQGGTINIPDVAAYKSAVGFSVEPSKGYRYEGVIIADTSDHTVMILDKDTYSFEMPMKDIKVTPIFVKESYSVSINNVTGGTVTVDRSSAGYEDMISLTIIPEEGYEYNGAIVTYDGETMSLDETKNGFKMPASNVSISPKWNTKNYTITTENVTGGRIVIAGTSAYKSVVNFSTEAEEGYEYNGTTLKNALGAVIGTLSATETSFTMPSSNITIAGKWKKKSYSITQESVTGGNITIDSSATYGDTVSFTPNKEGGYSYKGATVKNSSGQVITTLTSSQKSFVMPASNVTITPSFGSLPQMRTLNLTNNTTNYYYKYKIKITSIVIKNNTEIPSTAVHMDNMDSGKDYWDLSETRNRDVVAYIEGDYDDYKLTIGGQGGVLAPINSEYL